MLGVLRCLVFERRCFFGEVYDGVSDILFFRQLSTLLLLVFLSHFVV